MYSLEAPKIQRKNPKMRLNEQMNEKYAMQQQPTIKKTLKKKNKIFNL